MTSPIHYRSLFATILLGISSGLPLLATGSTLQIWMRESGIDLKSVGLAAWLGVPYSFKFVWAPLMDRIQIGFLGRRRGWIVLTQILLMAAFFLMSLADPIKSPVLLIAGALLVSFWSASQDIVIDAHRRDLFPPAELGLASGFFVTGYRIGMLIGGAGALWLADLESVSWQTVYRTLGVLIMAGVAGTLLIPEPASSGGVPRSLRAAIIDPLKDFFGRQGIKTASLILAFITLYKMGDSLASAMTAPFYVDVGYTKSQIAEVVKIFGLISTIVGSLVGGAVVYRIGINKSLWIFGVLQALSTAGFSILAFTGPSVPALAAVIAFENLSSGMGTSAYAAYMGIQCDKRFSVTQYALLSSLMAIPRTVLAGGTGFAAAALGYAQFFVFCAVLAIPGMLLLPYIAPWRTTSASGQK